MRPGIYIIIACWTFFNRAGGRTALLPEFNFKKVSRTNDGRSPVSFSGIKLLNRGIERPKEKTRESRVELPDVTKSKPFKNFKQVTRGPIRHQVISTKQTAIPQKLPIVQSTWLQLPTNNVGNSKLPLHVDRTLPLQTDKTFKGKSSTKNVQLTKVLPRQSQKSSKWHVSPQKTTNAARANALEITLVGQKVSHILPTKSVSFKKDVSPFKKDVTENPLSNSEVTVVVKSEGTPRPVEELPYCSWIDPSNCPDFSKVRPSCIETLSISSLRGECKMCPFNWCKGPNDMAGSGKLHDQSPLDVVLNAGGRNMPSKYGLAVNVPGSGSKQSVSNFVNKPPSSTTTEIPFWNFETFGP
ncbi:uncharacterized protein LOC133193827 [Saccostrea echinata]|uniref:uncharacterized protein LOC133193827 n=1 Tax=Saccostrea echinata TaxID=191078 RepID=UPI002A82CD0F|nr:uncharacterized protein LOC133193827 [Saccostrea echinata]